MKNLLLIFMLLFLSPPFAAAQTSTADSCQSCIERKQTMCAEECELVKPEQARGCQKRCISGYCSHRCAANAAELESFIAPKCDSCLEQQFALCEGHCKEGTARSKAICQVNCSAARCVDACPKK